MKLRALWCSYIVIYIGEFAIIVVDVNIVIILSMSFAMYPIYLRFARGGNECAQIERSDQFSEGAHRTNNTSTKKKPEKKNRCTRVRLRSIFASHIAIMASLHVRDFMRRPQCKINSTDKTTCYRQLLSRLLRNVVSRRWKISRFSLASKWHWIIAKQIEKYRAVICMCSARTRTGFSLPNRKSLLMIIIILSWKFYL